ncbi:MAG: GldG family protein [Puniceicoccales bacterium]|jgi:hypothetical protein|nr:GldG family protein [Puniceicoccales bacterium]
MLPPAGKMKRDAKDFSRYALYRKLSRWVWISIGIAIFLSVFFFSQKYFVRYDLHKNRASVLSSELVDVLKGLKERVDIHVILPVRDDDWTQDFLYYVRRLLRECVALCPQKLRVHYANAIQVSAALRNLGSDPSLSLEDYSLLLISRESVRTIDGKKLFRLCPRGRMEFHGESELQHQLQVLQQPFRKKIYFLTGHGEMALRSTHETKGLSGATSFLEKNHYRLEELELMQRAEVPQDADAIVIVGAISPLMKAELALLERYLDERSGRILVFLSPLCPHGLEWLFFHRGIWADPHRVAEAPPESRLPSDEIIVRRFAEHAAMETVYQKGLGVLMSRVQAVQPDIGAPLLDHQHVIPLLWTSDNAHLLDEEFPKEERGGEAASSPERTNGLFSLGSLSERTSPPELGVAMDHGKLIVIGNADALGNTCIQSLGNRYFLLGLLQYLLNESADLSLPSVEVAEYRLQLTRAQLQKCWKLFFLPGLLALFFGFGVYLARRDS